MEYFEKAIKDFRIRIFGTRAGANTSVAPMCKFLVQKSQKDDGINGITEKVFKKYVFPSYPVLAQQLFAWVQAAGPPQHSQPHVPPAIARAHCERLMAMLDDALITETYVRMFSYGEDEAEEGETTPSALRRLLHCSYQLAMDHYPEGPQTCLTMNKTLSAVVRGCFSNKESHSVGFVVRWLEEHCHRLVHPVHRYCVHTLATRHRELSTRSDGECGELALGTPVLARAPSAWGDGLLTLSHAWLLAAAAPTVYSMPLHPPIYQGIGAGGRGLASAAWLSRLLCAVPSHWTPLYRSREHGLGANRFLHHTLNYRGPTLVLLQAQELVVALCAPEEWRDTHTYWGGPDAALLQLQPAFMVVERAPKMLYLNSCIRGYARGLRAGADPRAPALAVDADFDKLTYKGVPYALTAIEVWGCGTRASRDSQLEVKKWQVKEAERHRCVKLSAADWMEHPDRYLLELAGRPQYNNSAS